MMMMILAEMNIMHAWEPSLNSVLCKIEFMDGVVEEEEPWEEEDRELELDADRVCKGGGGSCRCCCGCSGCVAKKLFLHRGFPYVLHQIIVAFIIIIIIIVVILGCYWFFVFYYNCHR